MLLELKDSIQHKQELWEEVLMIDRGSFSQMGLKKLDFWDSTFITELRTLTQFPDSFRVVSKCIEGIENLGICKRSDNLPLKANWACKLASFTIYLLP